MTTAFTIVRDLTCRGQKKILVDGVIWGIIHFEQRGIWGSKYWFSQQGDHGAICDPNDKNTYGDPRQIYVRSGGRHAKPDDKPTDVKLTEAVADLLERGLLRDPIVVRKENEEWRKKIEENQRRAKERERQRDVAVGLKIVEQFNGIRWQTDEGKKLIAEAIADAIEHGRGE
jgi:hypothetical protein